MSWIRLSDDYNDHPKFDNLSDGAFRLWHQGMGFCRKFKTDGMIPIKTVREFKAFQPKRMKELMTPWQDGENPLWHDRGHGWGVIVHDYLQWNPSKDEDTERRDGSRQRMRESRERRIRPGVAPQQTCNNAATSTATAQHVAGMDREDLNSKKELSPILRGAIRPLAANPDPEIASRAGLLLEKYAELFYDKRRGARYHARPHLDFPKACDLVTTWTDDARLEKLAVIVLTTDDEWIARSDRGFGIFAAKASWADDKLRVWELANGMAV